MSIFQQGTSFLFADLLKKHITSKYFVKFIGVSHISHYWWYIAWWSCQLPQSITFFSSFSSLFCANKIYCFHWKPRKLSNIPIIKLLHSQTVIPSTNHTTITARPLKSVCVRVFDMHVKLTIMTAIQYSSQPKLIVSRYVLGSNRVDSGSCQQV